MVPLDAALGSQETSRLEKQRRGSSQQATPERLGKNSNSQALLSVSLSLSGSTGQGWGPGIMDILPGPTDTSDASTRSLALKGLRSRPG